MNNEDDYCITDIIYVREILYQLVLEGKISWAEYIRLNGSLLNVSF